MLLPKKRTAKNHLAFTVRSTNSRYLAGRPWSRGDCSSSHIEALRQGRRTSRGGSYLSEEGRLVDFLPILIGMLHGLGLTNLLNTASGVFKGHEEWTSQDWTELGIMELRRAYKRYRKTDPRSWYLWDIPLTTDQIQMRVAHYVLTGTFRVQVARGVSNSVPPRRGRRRAEHSGFACTGCDLHCSSWR